MRRDIPFYLLNKSRTTPNDLRKIADMLGFDIDFIGYGNSYPLIKDNNKLSILNLGNSAIGGTHWVAVNNESKEYFDPLGGPPPDYIPSNFKNNNHHTIQNMNWGHCGQYCVYFLYHSNMGKSKDFFKLFKKGYYE